MCVTSSEVVTSSTDKTICIWDLATCERIKKFKGHKQIVNSVDTSVKLPQLFCSASDDNTVKVTYN